ncbi:single-stranded-DNA-specific exonuclease [Azospirillaceae bacterium]
MNAIVENAFLNVEQSITGRLWQSRPTNDRLALALSQGWGLPEIVGRVLAGRGVGPEDVDAFLSPTLRSMLPNPSQFKDMDVAAERLAKAVANQESVAVFADYDVDGATSAALLIRFLRSVGCSPRLYIPDRIGEGYGPSSAALLRLHDEGVRLVVTVDCGTTAHVALESAAKVGLDVIVVDHHAAEPRLPPALAVVNPNRIDEDIPYRTLCAAGVTFLVIVAVNRALRAAGWYGDRLEPNLMNWLDLVALGTVCDVMPLTGLNRALVAQGLKVMGRRGNPGLATLADVAGMRDAPTAYHLGFILGPRVNAGGRVGGADVGARLLSTDDSAEALLLARQLDQHNEERRAVEAQVLEEALARVDLESPPPLVFVVGEGWHPGVIGIVAARLKERLNRPTCVVATEEGIGRASGRSVMGIDLGAAVIAARQAGLLVNGGGHRMAAGFTVVKELIEPLRVFLVERILAQSSAPPTSPVLELDGALMTGAATMDLARSLEKLGPFGNGNSEPRFAIPDARIVRADVLRDSHVRCIVSGRDGGRLKAIAFRVLDSGRPEGLGRALLESGGQPMHLAGPLRLNHWNGADSVQLIIEDAALAGRSISILPRR